MACSDASVAAARLPKGEDDEEAEEEADEKEQVSMQ